MISSKRLYKRRIVNEMYINRRLLEHSFHAFLSSGQTCDAVVDQNELNLIQVLLSVCSEFSTINFNNICFGKIKNTF